ncbi:hypothetical protein THOM_0666 [Trachipleistophora hominis]|uniref:Uncharacterized protein n=1 Tax=Trachipleistophora hominis TaxID=72359 RepID=L7JY42_TRAHO|nr:hypothetical protein THOM_0666 [Trachipleistophora hominis]
MPPLPPPITIRSYIRHGHPAALIFFGDQSHRRTTTNSYAKDVCGTDQLQVKCAAVQLLKW